MRLHELKQIRIDKPYLSRWLKDLGFDVSNYSEGSFGRVYSHPNKNIVAKVWKNDPCYDSFVEYVRARNGNNPYLPKISAPKEVFVGKTKLASKWKLVFIEKLSPTTNDWTTEFGHGVEWIFDDKLDLQDDYEAQHAMIDSLESHYPGIVQTLIDMTKFWSREMSGWDGCDTDLHDGNIMMRGKTPVIIDPWYQG